MGFPSKMQLTNEHANFTIGGGLPSISRESKAFALRSKLGDFILCPKALSTCSRELLV